MGIRDRVRQLMLGRVAAAGMLAVLGCGGSQIPEPVLVRAGQVFVDIDDWFADRYEHARVTCRERSSSWDELDSCIADWEGARNALEALRFSLLMAGDAQDGEIACATANVAEALSRLRTALRHVGLDPPAPASSAEAALRKVGERCQ